MADRHDEPEAATGPGPDQAGPTAEAVALGRASKSGKALDAEALAFLRDQRRLINLQAEHLRDQGDLQMSRLRWGRFSDRMKAALEVMTALVGLTLAGVVGAMAWQAHQDHGLVVEAFSTPPDLAARGLSGQVIATQLLDRLRELQAGTVTNRPAESYANDWGGDIKVEIPETGVSIGDLNRYLRQWLGSETRITGEVWRTPAGLAITARAGEASGRTFEGADVDLTSLVEQAAEAVYSQTQPYRYAVYLRTHGRPDEALAAFARLATSGPPQDRPWANAAWSTALLQQGDFEGAAVHGEEAHRHGILNVYGNLIQSYGTLSHEEAWLASARLQNAYARKGRTNPEFQPGADLHAATAAIARLHGDFRTAAIEFEKFNQLIPSRFSFEGQARTAQLRTTQVEVLAQDHDVSAARRLLTQAAAPNASTVGKAETAQLANASIVSNAETAQLAIEMAVGDWAGAAGGLEASLARDRQLGAAVSQSLHRRVWSNLALAYAHLGRRGEADGMIAQASPDCDECLRAHGEIAALDHDWAGVDRWYAAAARHAPSTPFADAGWGAALLARGELDAAIARLSQAHKKGPRFADPLELWGEALMRKGDFTGAVAKFTEADKDAPRWGRNHLRWGEALARLGRADEARAQWLAAAGMDLSSADRAELAQAQKSLPAQTS